MPRGGPRQGKIGAQYPNRQDMSRPLPVTTVPGQTYGQAGQQAAAQRAVPMGPAPQGSPNPQPQAPAPQGPAPGESGLALMRDTERPNEPVTAGLPGGAGPGPEALTGVGQMAMNQDTSQRNVRDFLTSLASDPGAPQAVHVLAGLANAGVQ